MTVERAEKRLWLELGTIGSCLRCWWRSNDPFDLCTTLTMRSH